MSDNKFVMDRRSLLGASAALAALMVAAGTSTRAIAAVSARVEALVSRMTLEEKIGQLTLYPDDVRPTPRPINPDINAQAAARDRAAFQFVEIKAGRVGSLLGGTGVAQGRSLQEAALSSRLGIPLMFGADVLHGLRTIFPIPLGLAASFEPSLARETARAAAAEMTAVGVHWTYAPMVDVARDQRWGRVAEGSGEDPYLASQFAAAYVEGFQGSDPRSHLSVAACPKHFAGYGAVIGGMEYNATDISERELRQTHLPPFKAAFDAGALTTMAAFNDLDGIPASGNRRLLTDILRGELGFNGFVVSDAGSVEELVEHGVAADESEAALLGLVAGVDVNMGGGLYKRSLADLAASGKLPIAAIDESVRRVLAVKEAIGLFDDPYRSLDIARETTEIRTPDALALAHKAAVKSVVLLRNENRVLPLRADARLALIGPLGDDPTNLDGPWAPWARNEGVTLARGLKDRLGADRVTVEQGSGVDAPIEGGITRAIAAARGAEIVVLAVGESQNMSGEARSRTEIVIPAAQQALADAVAATGRPVIVVLSCGRALALEGSILNADALLVGWFLGSQSGPAVADILTGRESPSGRLPVSFPQSSGQQPYFYNHKSTGRPQAVGEPNFFKARYVEVSNAALYPFGFGLTYSTIAYERPTVSSAAIPWEGRVSVSAKLRNTGDRTIEEVAQLYVHDLTASLTRPVRELKAFKKITLEPGAEATVSFDISRGELAFVGSDLQWRTEAGDFLAWICPSSADGEPVRFTLNSKPNP